MGDTKTYAAGHIPGARLLRVNHFSRSSGGSSGSLQLELPDPAAFTMQIQHLGAATGANVVVVFGKDEVAAATRVIWALESTSVAAHIALLDGGLPEWKRRGHPLSVESRTFARSQLSPPAMSHVPSMCVAAHPQNGRAFALPMPARPNTGIASASRSFPSGEGPAGHFRARAICPIAAC